MSATQPASYINHFALVIDESGSMWGHKRAVVRVVDEYVKFLAQLSVQQEQETRATVYTFSSRGREKCLFYDKDVLRMPSIDGLYDPNGQTALVDATLLAVSELRQTAMLHGLHSLMVTAISDGFENSSRHRPDELASTISALPDNWTTAAFGPNANAVHSLKKCGFPAGNVSTWDTASSAGIEEVGVMLRTASANLMEGRKHGVHGYNSRSAPGGGLFQLRDFSADDVKNTATPLTKGSYFFLDVAATERIDEFVTREAKRAYVVGTCYYQFTKTEKIQPQKAIAVELDGQVYSGPAARAVLGLPTDHEVRVRLDQKAGCTIFVQSTSHNRHLIPGTRLLLMR